jgi:hypothetical protein
MHAWGYRDRRDRAEKTACTECTCNSCASVLGKCVADEDCGPILQCNIAGGDCQGVMDEHSSAAGMAQRVSFCLQARCEAECFGG